MKTKRILSIVIAVVMMLALSVPAFAEASYFVALDVASSVTPGEDFDVIVKVLTPEVSQGVGFVMTYDKDNVTYKSFEAINAPSSNSNVTDNGDGTLELASVMDGKQYTSDNTEWIKLTFTAAEVQESTEITFTTEYSDDVCFMNADADIVDEDNISFGSATTSIAAPEAAHTAPVVTASITGDGMIGKALTAGAEVTDSLNLTPTLTYDWSINGVSVGTGETYTPTAAQIGKEITLTVTATVEADENPTGTGTATITVINNPDAKPVVTASSENVTIENGADNTVTVTVSVASLTAFANLGIEIGYNADVLTLTNAVGTGISGAELVAAPAITANPYYFTWNSADNIVYNGTLATLTFTVKGSTEAGTYPITVSFYKGHDGNYVDGDGVNYDGNYAPLNLEYVDGGVTVGVIVDYPGDINGDKKTNNDDATTLMKYIAKWNVTVDTKALDTNGDGKVNSKDVTNLLRWLANWPGIELHYTR